MVAAAGSKTISHTSLQDQQLSFRPFLEKLAFLMKMDWVEVSLYEDKGVKRFFETWESFIAILPICIRQMISDSFLLYHMVSGEHSTRGLPVEI